MPFTGVSVHYLVREVDRGAVISQRWVPIFQNDSLNRLYRLCFVLSYEASVEAFRKLRLSVEPICVENEGLEPSYFSFPNDEDWREFRSHGGKFI